MWGIFGKNKKEISSQPTSGGFKNPISPKVDTENGLFDIMNIVPIPVENPKPEIPEPDDLFGGLSLNGGDMPTDFFSAPVVIEPESVPVAVVAPKNESEAISVSQAELNNLLLHALQEGPSRRRFSIQTALNSLFLENTPVQIKQRDMLISSLYYSSDQFHKSIIQLKESSLTKEHEIIELNTQHQTNIQALQQESDQALYKIKSEAIQKIETVQKNIDQQKKKAVDDALSAIKKSKGTDPEVTILKKQMEDLQKQTEDLLKEARAQHQQELNETLTREKKRWEDDKMSSMMKITQQMNIDLEKALDLKQKDFEEKLSTTIDQVKKECAHQSNQGNVVSDTDSNLGTMKTRLQELESQYHNVVLQHENDQVVIKHLNDQIASHEHQGSNTNSNDKIIESLTTSFQQTMDEEQTKHKQEISELNKKILEIGSSNNKNNTENETILQKTISDLNEELVKCQSELEKEKKQIESLKIEHEKQLFNVNQEKSATLSDETNSLNNMKSDFEKQIAHLQEDYEKKLLELENDNKDNIEKIKHENNDIVNQLKQELKTQTEEFEKEKHLMQSDLGQEQNQALTLAVEREKHSFEKVKQELISNQKIEHDKLIQNLRTEFDTEKQSIVQTYEEKIQRVTRDYDEKNTNLVKSHTQEIETLKSQFVTQKKEALERQLVDKQSEFEKEKNIAIDLALKNQQASFGQDQAVAINNTVQEAINRERQAQESEKTSLLSKQKEELQNTHQTLVSELEKKHSEKVKQMDESINNLKSTNEQLQENLNNLSKASAKEITDLKTNFDIQIQSLKSDFEHEKSDLELSFKTSQIELEKQLKLDFTQKMNQLKESYQSKQQTLIDEQTKKISELTEQHQNSIEKQKQKAEGISNQMKIDHETEISNVKTNFTHQIEELSKKHEKTVAELAQKLNEEEEKYKTYQIQYNSDLEKQKTELQAINQAELTKALTQIKDQQDTLINNAILEARSQLELEKTERFNELMTEILTKESEITNLHKKIWRQELLPDN